MPGDFDAPPIRPGAAPTLSVSAVGFSSVALSQPIWFRMTEVLVRWLRFHFSDATRIEYPNLVNRVWTDNESSPIVIDSLARWNPKQSQERPCVLVDRLDQEEDMAHRSIGPQFQGIKPGYFCDFMIGRHVIHCLGGRDGEAETLASEIWRELKRFSSIAREYLCLYRFLPERIVKRHQLADEFKEHFATSVLVSYNYQESWAVRPADEAEIRRIMTTFSLT